MSDQIRSCVNISSLQVYPEIKSETAIEDVKIFDGQDSIQPQFVFKCEDIKTEVKEEVLVGQ